MSKFPVISRFFLNEKDLSLSYTDEMGLTKVNENW